MKVVVGMPWRPGEGRLLAHAAVRAYYSVHLPGVDVIEVDTQHQPYNLAASRNLAVREAESAGADVVVVADADCVFYDPKFMHEAIAAAAEDGKVHMPFRQQRYLTEQETVAFAMWWTLPPLVGKLGNGCCYIMKPEAYWRAGGGDERFSGWGGDDDQFVAAATTLTGLVRHGGVSLSLWHPAVRDVGSERHRPNAELAKRYWSSMHDEAAMRALIAERQQQ